MLKTIRDEEDWHSCDDPDKMVFYLKEQFRTSRKKYSHRKARLFVVACCRRVWTLMKDDRARHAIDVLELYADGKATPQELQAVEVDAAEVEKGFVMALGFVRNVRKSSRAQISMQSKRPLPVWDKAHMATSIPAVSADNRQAMRAEARVQTKLLRDIFGNPFNPVTIERTCQTSEVVDLAQTIYDGCSFEKLPALAKALREAGCLDKEILNHCRTKAPHVRGCWVVDLVLEKRAARI